MQKWEYAGITMYWTDIGGLGNVGKKWIRLVYLHPDGPESKVLKEDNMGSKLRDYSEQLREWIMTLGLDGYEITGNSTFMNAGMTYDEYWFKRPL